MRRRAPDEFVEPLRLDRLAELEPLRRRAARWAGDHLDVLHAAEPDMPAGLNDRAADNWRPLLAIAELIGGRRPQAARRAAQILNGAAEAEESAAGIVLLADIRDLFRERGVDRLSSAEIVEALVKLEERPWPEWRRGQPLTAAGLARLLRPFGIRPRPMDWRGAHPKGTRGYAHTDFADAWGRDLPVEAQPAQPSSDDGENPESENRNRGDRVALTDIAEKPHKSSEVAGVALPEGGDGTGGAGPGLEELDAGWWSAVTADAEEGAL
jgi:hypothetical protein